MKLQSSPFAGLAFVAWSHAATVTVKAGGSTNLVYEPAMATASPGDVMEFHFLAHNHSAIMGEFGNPCMPAGDGKGFSSGFWPVSAGENGTVFQVTINDTNPIVYYCAQTTKSHCESGMIGFINSDNTTAQESYISMAKAVPTAKFPGSVFGGILMANPDTSAVAAATSAATSGSSMGMGMSTSMSMSMASSMAMSSSASGTAMTTQAPSGSQSATTSAASTVQSSDAAGILAQGSFVALVGSGLLACAMAMMMA